jgi:hypothetical protein
MQFILISTEDDMSNLVAHAELELREAGWFKKDEEGGVYDGMIGTAVLELVQKFAEQGHSGNSAGIVVALFRRVATYQLLNPLRNPMETGEYMEVGHLSNDHKPVYQSTRKSSLFSDDDGKTWYDIDQRVPWWKRIFGVRRAYVKFAH